MRRRLDWMGCLFLDAGMCWFLLIITTKYNLIKTCHGFLQASLSNYLIKCVSLWVLLNDLHKFILNWFSKIQADWSTSTLKFLLRKQSELYTLKFQMISDSGCANTSSWDLQTRKNQIRVRQHQLCLKKILFVLMSVPSNPRSQPVDNEWTLALFGFFSILLIDVL